MSASESLDLSTPYGIFFGTMIVAFAELERDSTATRTRAAKDTRRQAGLRTDVEPPYGWRNEPTGGKRPDGRPEFRVVRDEGEQAVIEVVLRLRAIPYSYREICGYLDERGIKPRHSRRWSRSTVRNIIEEARHGAREHP